MNAPGMDGETISLVVRDDLKSGVSLAKKKFMYRLRISFGGSGV